MSPDVMDTEAVVVETQTMSETTTALIPIDPNANALVPTPSKDDVWQETEVLIATIRNRGEAELDSLNSMTRDAYLTLVRQMRGAIAPEPFLTPERIEQSIQMWQHETEKNWLALSHEMNSLATRVMAEKNWLVVSSELESLGFQFADSIRANLKSWLSTPSNSD